MIPLEINNKAFGDITYQFAFEIMEKQQDVNWFAKEIKVENDIQDFTINLTTDELQLVKKTLQLFVEREQGVGDIWGQIASWYPHSEIIGACKVIETMELSVHSFFYQKISDVLNIDPYLTIKEQKESKELTNSLEMVADIVTNAEYDKPLALGTLAFIEQVLLFGNFAMLKSFQANGNNKIINTMQGVNLVIADEILHGKFAGMLFKQVLTELGSEYNTATLYTELEKVSKVILDHEFAVIDRTFKDGVVINGITGKDLKAFLVERVNSVFELLGLDKIKLKELICDTRISDWFFKSNNSLTLTDFFAKGGSYTRDWSEESFSRLPYIKGIK